MIENVIRIIVDGSGNVIDQPSSNDTIRALNNAVDKIVMIAPFPVENWASVSFLRYNATPLEQYLYSRAAPVSNYVESDETFSGYTYHDIADWTVYEADIKATALAYISKHRNGSILISLANGELAINSKCITFQGTFGIDSPLPTTGQTEGDYYMCEDYLFNMADNGNGRAYVFGKGQYVYWNGSYWVKVLLQKKIGTATIEIPVDPSYAEGYELDDDDINYLATIGADVVLIDGRLTVVENFKTDVDNGDYVFPQITLDNGTIIRENTDKNTTERVFTDGTILQDGLELWAYIRNESGGTLLNGEVVAINGVVGQQLSAVRANPDDDDLHFKEIGVVTMSANIAANAEGKVTHFGEVNGVPVANFENTGVAYAENQELFVSVNGKLTNVEPVPPITHIHAGWVLRVIGSTANIFVYFVKVPHLDHLSDVDDTGLVTGDNLQYNQSTKIWSRDGRTTSLVTANMFKDVSYTASTGVLTFTLYDNTTKTIDLPLELIVESGYYDEATNELVLVLANASEIRIPVGDLLTDLDAINVRYDNGDSTLVAVNVKTAIDELDGKAETNASNIATHETRLDNHDTDIANLQAKDIALETKEAEQDKRLNELDEVARKIAYGETSASVNDTEVIALPKNTANGQLKPQIEGMTLQATQLVTNGDFSNGTTDWVVSSGSAINTVLNGILISTGTGTLPQLIQSRNVTALLSSKYYYAIRHRTTSTDVSLINIRVAGINKLTTNTPTQNQWYFNSLIETILLDPIDLRLETTAPTTVTDKVLEVDYIIAFDIATLIANKTYSPLYDTTFDLMSDAEIKAQMDLWVSNGTLPNDNIQSVSGNLRLNAVGKNLFDKGNIVVDKYVRYDNGVETTLLNVNASDYIRIKPNTSYYISGIPNSILATFPNRTQVAYFDSNLIYISGDRPTVTGATITTPVNAIYLRVSVHDLDLNTAQLEVGTVATTYEPYQNSEMFIEANRKLYGLNEVYDKLVYRNGKVYGKYNYDTSGTLLGSLIETEVKTVGQILGSSKGTVYVEKAMRDVDMYSTQFDISNTSYPISSLIKVIKLVDGGELELDVNDATIAVDGLSFTHTGLSSGDFVYIVYAYDLDNTIYGTTRITYYNSDLVRISPDGTAYKLDWSVDNAGAITWSTSEVL